MKIEVPIEFDVFLENAVNVINKYESLGKGIPTIVEDIARFQNYIRGRTDELNDIAALATEPKLKEHLGEKVLAIMNLQKELMVIYNYLMDQINVNTKGG